MDINQRFDTSLYLDYDGYIPRKSDRYLKTLKTLKPLRFTRKHAPIDNVGLFSTITFSWLSDVLYKARKEISFEDLPAISESDKVESTAPRLHWYYQDERKKRGKEANIGNALARFVRTRYFIAVLLGSISFILGIIVPTLVVNQLILYTSMSSQNLAYGVGLCFAMFVGDVGRALTLSASHAIAHRTILRVRNGLAQLLYWKLIRLKSFNQKSAGEMINYLVNDMQRVVEFLVFGTILFSAPVGIITGTVCAGFVLGWTGIMGLIGFMLLLPIQAIAVKLGVKYRANSVRLTDRRVRILNELLNGIKMIKFYAWEKSFEKVIGCIRKKEGEFLAKAAALQVIISGLIPISPTFVTVLTLLLHTGLGYSLTAPQAFSTMVIFNSMRIAIGVLPISVRSFTEALVAVRRFNELLNMEEMEEYQVPVSDVNNAIELKNLTVAPIYIKEEQPKLRKDKRNPPPPSPIKETNNVSTKEVRLLNKLNLLVQRGSLIGVCGAVGSGKSSLIASILGQVRFKEGSVGINGNIAYVSQQAWVFHASLRENVLFGMPYDKIKYQQTISACALQADVNILPNGDLTEIGERGINLSGGQKQRVSLARAVYSERDIVLLDDPLSAVDVHVGKHIFEECIRKQLNGKTVILVSHQLQYFKHCDNVVMLKDGHIANQGSYNELLEQSHDFSNLIRNIELQSKSKRQTNQENDGNTELETNTDKAPRPLRSVSSGSTKNATSFALTEKESQAFGAVSWKTYKTYLTAMGGYLLAVFIFFHAFLVSFLGTATNYWITYWINEGGQCLNGTDSLNTTTASNHTACNRDRNIVTNPRKGFYQMIYGIILLATFVVLVTRALSFPLVPLRASSRLHKQLFRNMMRYPMAFFDRTPTGRILNRFSKDVDEMDSRLPAHLNSTLQLISLGLLSFITICIIFPYFLIACVLFIVCYVLLLNLYRSGIREVKRYENVHRSPWISHVTATVYGLSSIHAYQKTEVFIKHFANYINDHSAPLYVYFGALWWIGVRLDAFNIIINFIVALMVVLASSYPQVFGLGGETALAGLALTYSVQISGILQSLTRFMVETETVFTAVERVREYSDLKELEKPSIVDDSRPPVNWPQHGAIAFKNATMRYRNDLPDVLRDVSFEIKQKEKIGIAGRTGSGKSSLGMALFRLVELSSGQIFIDDVDVGKIGLEDLRKIMTIIPQDPILFVGTIRYNLDPFSKYSDDEVWQALKRSHIKDMIQRLPNKLESEVVENGENFSVGERQLLCMARAILRHSKIIMLDEATAAIDSETDSLVQDTIREAFADCTVLTIAHRLNTISNCDKILVMSEGQVAEFDDTQSLMKNPQSSFSQLLTTTLKQSNNENYQQSANKNANSNYDTAAYVNSAFTSD